MTHWNFSGVMSANLMSPRTHPKVSQSFHHHTLSTHLSGNPAQTTPLLWQKRQGHRDWFYVHLQSQNRHPSQESGGKFNWGKRKDQVIGKEVEVPEPRPAWWELAPCQCCGASLKTYPSVLDPIFKLGEQSRASCWFCGQAAMGLRALMFAYCLSAEFCWVFLCNFFFLFDSDSRDKTALQFSPCWTILYLAWGRLIGWSFICHCNTK